MALEALRDEIANTVITHEQPGKAKPTDLQNGADEALSCDEVLGPRAVSTHSAQTAVASGVRVDGEDADHGRVEVEGLGPGLCVASVLEQGFDLAGGIAGGARRGPWAAGLGCDGDVSAGSESPA